MAKKSKIGSMINVKGYRRKVGKLPARGPRGRFSKGRRRGKGSGGQTKLF